MGSKFIDIFREKVWCYSISFLLSTNLMKRPKPTIRSAGLPKTQQFLPEDILKKTGFRYIDRYTFTFKKT